MVRCQRARNLLSLACALPQRPQALVQFVAFLFASLCNCPVRSFCARRNCGCVRLVHAAAARLRASANTTKLQRLELRYTPECRWRNDRTSFRLVWVHFFCAVSSFANIPHVIPQVARHSFEQYLVVASVRGCMTRTAQGAARFFTTVAQVRSVACRVTNKALLPTP